MNNSSKHHKLKKMLTIKKTPDSEEVIAVKNEVFKIKIIPDPIETKNKIIPKTPAVLANLAFFPALINPIKKRIKFTARNKTNNNDPIIKTYIGVSKSHRIFIAEPATSHLSELVFNNELIRLFPKTTKKIIPAKIRIINNIIKNINPMEENLNNLDSQNFPIFAKPLRKIINPIKNNKNKMLMVIIKKELVKKGEL